MPELGDYAGYVLSAYGVTILLVAALVIVSVVRSDRVRRRLEALESGRKDSSDG